jgi:hypothetical protein
MNEDVDKYIERQKSLQREIIQRLRMIILKTFPKIKEEFKWGVPWYDMKFYIGALRDHVNLGFSIRDLSKKEIDLFEGSGKTMRHIKIFSLDQIDEEKIIKLLKMVKKDDE